MKKILVFLLLGTFWLGTSLTRASELYSGNDEISLRIRSIDSHLAGIVSDTITDMLWNPARMPSKSFISFQVPNRIITLLPGPMKTRWGILLEGSYQESESEHRETGPSHYRYYYTDYLSSISSSYSRKTYKGALLGSKQATPNTCIGLRLDYQLKPYKNSGDRLYRSTYYYESNYDSHHQLEIRDAVREYNSADTTSFYSLSVGTHSSIWKSNLEIVLKYGKQKEASHFLDNWRDIRYAKYIRTYDSTTYIDIYNNESEELSDEYNFLNPKIWSLGFRLSRDITPASTFRTIALFYTGWGDAHRKRGNLGYNYRDRYHSYSDPDTFYAYIDTIESYHEDEATLDGDANILGGFLAIGLEFNVSPQFTGGTGIRISYKRNEVKLEGAKKEVNDTLTSHSIVEEKEIKRIAYVYLPLGIEYRPIPEFAIRGGVNLYGFYHFSEENLNGRYNKSKNFSGPNYTLSFGVGYTWRRLKFDIHTMDIAAVKSWNIEVAYSL